MVPSRLAGFISPSQAVRLRYDAFPFQKYGEQDGQVENVTNLALVAGDPANPGRGSLADPDRAVAVVIVRLNRQTVEADGMKLPLQAGMRVAASIPLERRWLYEWVLEPVISRFGHL